MGETLDQLRAKLARHVQRYITGTATGGTTATLIDTSGLARFTDDDALNGALLYISDTTDEQAPEGEARFVTDYIASSKTLTVSPAFSAAPGAGDTYELYLAPLQLDDWDQCVNDAIGSAWPVVFKPTITEAAIDGGPDYALPAAAEGVAKVEIAPVAAGDLLTTIELPVTGARTYTLPLDCENVLRVELAGQWDEQGQIVPEGFYHVDGTLYADLALWLRRSVYQVTRETVLRITYQRAQPMPIPAGAWSVAGAPGALTLYLLDPPPQPHDAEIKLRITYKEPYPAISGTTETDLDEIYIMAAARSYFYAMMADNAGAESARAGYLQLMAHWQEQAAQRRQELAAMLARETMSLVSMVDDDEKKKGKKDAR